MLGGKATLAETIVVVLRLYPHIACIDHWRGELAVVIVIIMVLLLLLLFLFFSMRFWSDSTIDLLDISQLLNHHALLLTLAQDTVLADLKLA